RRRRRADWLARRRPRRSGSMTLVPGPSFLVLGPSLAARGESRAAFDGRCIPGGCVAPPSNTGGILSRRALPAGRLARLGATPDFHHGLLASSRRGRSRRSRICASCFFGATTEKTPQVLAQAGLGNLTTATAYATPSRAGTHSARAIGRAPGHGRHGAEAHAGGRASTCPMPRCISRLLMDQLHGWLTGAARGASGRAELRARRSHRC